MTTSLLERTALPPQIDVVEDAKSAIHDIPFYGEEFSHEELEERLITASKLMLGALAERDRETMEFYEGTVLELTGLLYPHDDEV